VLTPAIELRTGDRLVLLLDGRPVAKEAGKDFELTKLGRGTHTLQATVQNASGGAIIQSAAVQFNMWEASRLFPNREQ
jgi:hypothetical protein